jgi:hypothetical protein
MLGGRIAKARRGELAVPLPSGFVRRPSGEVVLDPDEQVRAVIALIFSLFDQIGTVGGVLAYLAGNQIQVGIRLREGPWCRTCSAIRLTLGPTHTGAVPATRAGGSRNGPSAAGHG